MMISKFLRLGLFSLTFCGVLLHPAQSNDAEVYLRKDGISMTKDEAKESAKEALGYLLNSALAPQNDDGHQRSLFQGEANECNSLIGTLTVEEIRSMVIVLMQEQTPLGEFAIFALDSVILRNLKYDVQLWKICGRCAEFEDDIKYPKNAGCGRQDYGFNATHSGLLVVPYDAGRGELISTTLPVNIVPASESVVPSETGYPVTSHPALLGAVISSITRVYTLEPDFTGRGESKDYYRAFLIKQTYVTATLPLIWQAEAMVAEQSNCAAAMADAYSLVGYSQGGFQVVALADGLARMGKTIIAVYGGGAPYKLSTETLTYFVSRIKNGRLPIVFFVTLLAAALSSTTTDAANFGAGQDFLAEHVRDPLVHQAQLAGANRDPLFAYIPEWDPLSVYNQKFIALMEGGIARGESNPCVTSVTNETDKLCEALQENDLIHILESANYPMFLCHSSEDESIPYSNLPSISSNPDYLHIKTVTGTHWEASTPCIIDAVFFAANPFNLKWYRPADRTLEGGCEAGVSTGCNVWRRLFFRC
ncbi:expressed unknown protein [Seminavis robusta]|uniref:Uncharacterized protein n=1 Tax=Seminavis robusta TaxID=568900 RepID=A0A9N8D5C6_9STRA|nr:expressed unknown protein [Seminavis robusta]|eukprot:Sro4_g003640.1 n/a (534) ;mRNA; r:209642-211243